jgi:hypothetical protein
VSTALSGFSKATCLGHLPCPRVVSCSEVVRLMALLSGLSGRAFGCPIAVGMGVDVWGSRERHSKAQGPSPHREPLPFTRASTFPTACQWSHILWVETQREEVSQLSWDTPSKLVLVLAGGHSCLQQVPMGTGGWQAVTETMSPGQHLFPLCLCWLICKMGQET